MHLTKPRILATMSIALLGIHAASWSRGVTPYLPLNLSPEIERQIERVLVLADKPVMTRPIAAATVYDALPKACKVDAVACEAVRRYLKRYMRSSGITHASAELVATSGDSVVTVPNQHGMPVDSGWQASASVFWQPNDYALLTLGGVGNADHAEATGSALSLGFEYAQLDVGFRDHWFSPFTDSAMLISTEAPTMPSVTLSNYTPITFLGLQYQLFLAEMSYSDRIAYEDGYTAGNPRLAGLHAAIEPVPGWSLAFNRVMQFGGGARGGTSFDDIWRAFFRPRNYDNRSDDLTAEEEFGNQAASFTSRFMFPGRTPFSVYLEYAGEDTSYEGNYRLGNAALSAGIHFPRLWQRFDLTYEFSERQNGWYVHGIYQDGLVNDERVIGHWAGDHRQTGDDVGAQSHLLRVGWEPAFGGLMELRYRTLANETYSSVDYERAHDVTVRYSWPWGAYLLGAEVQGGRDVFGEDFGRLTGFVRFSDGWHGVSVDPVGSAAARPAGAELFVDVGMNVSELQIRLGDGSPKTDTGFETAAHLGLGARRAVSDRSDLGVRIEFDQVDSEMLLAVRALDYRYRFDGHFALTGFLGAARYDLATPAYGYYLGAGAQWRDLLPGWDLNFDLRYGDKIARDKRLPTDPGTDPRPDMFYDLTGATLYLSYRW